jgi:hypothetical protein
MASAEELQISKDKIIRVIEISVYIPKNGVLNKL